jgi:hypothetical protein
MSKISLQKSISGLLLFLMAALVSMVLSACEKTEIDNEKPIIDLQLENAFPQNCDTIYFGQEFTLRIRLKDNLELGSLSMNIHNNFDHHNHSTSVIECTLGPVKTPVNPIVYNQTFEIPDNLEEYLLVQKITLNPSDVNGDYDTGDYHLFFSLTDKSGWSDQIGLSIKILKP